MCLHQQYYWNNIGVRLDDVVEQEEQPQRPLQFQPEAPTAFSLFVSSYDGCCRPEDCDTSGALLLFVLLYFVVVAVVVDDDDYINVALVAIDVQLLIFSFSCQKQ
jgi:hypothetical protein